MTDKVRRASRAAKPGTSSKATGANAATARTAKPGNRGVHQEAILHGLRKFFDSVASEPIPDDFVALLEKLDVEEKSGTE
jgi:hypothetical protein